MATMKNRRNSDSKRIKEIKDISDGHFRSMHTTNKAEKFKFSKLAQGSYCGLNIWYFWKTGNLCFNAILIGIL